MDTDTWEYRKLAADILKVIGDDRESLQYFAENGVESTQLIYTYKCKNIFIENHSACWEIAEQQASEHGFNSLIDYLHECASIDSELELFERVVWLAAEYIGAQALYDLPALETCDQCDKDYEAGDFDPFCSYDCCHAYAIENDNNNFQCQ